ncbi:MAG: hypothetical protein RL272_1250 [Candidatus Parcubacteria bacterium]|jgi:hypothetical protein
MQVRRNIVRAIAAAGLAAIIALPVIAQAEEERNANAPTNSGSPSVTAVNEPKSKPEKPKNAVDAACMKAAVGKRDDAVAAAWDSLTAAAKTALMARKTALLAAWDLTDVKARRDAQKAAWKGFAASIRDARKSFRAARLSAWSQFKTDRRACRGNGEDASDAGMDAAL